MEDYGQMATSMPDGFRAEAVHNNKAVIQAEYKHKSRLVICGNFASWGEGPT